MAMKLKMNGKEKKKGCYMFIQEEEDGDGQLMK